MGSAFSKKTTGFKLEIVRSEKFSAPQNADEIMDAIKHCRYLINERLFELEEMEQSEEIDREIGVLIRQDQYLSVLESKQKYELAEIFFNAKNESNCIIPEILQWYTG